MNGMNLQIQTLVVKDCWEKVSMDAHSNVNYYLIIKEDLKEVTKLDY